MSGRLPIPKTYKLFVGGQFPRSESGRCLPLNNPNTGTHLANYAHASKKDLRDAVAAARQGLSSWRKASPYLRSQILYRVAEMLESRRATLAKEIVEVTGTSPGDAAREVGATIDLMVYFAGWCDKFTQIAGSVNPVSSPYFNFSSPEPVGIVAVLAPDQPSLLGLAGALAPVLVAANSTLVIASERFPLPAISLAEAFATADLPPGTVNILTGRRIDLAATLAGHGEIHAIVDASSDPATRAILAPASAIDLKRVHFRDLDPEDWFSSAEDLYPILATTEVKTTWHPIHL